MRKLKLFFSWQSDTKDNHKKISQALMNACDEIRAEGIYDIDYDESTWNRSGSPVIDSTVVEKAKKCDLFVADLTPIETSGTKDLPNPNVMYELGVAKNNLTDESILMLYTGSIEATRMPFDINHHRLSKFSNTHIAEYIRLMLRIFCEANKNKSLGHVHSINKEVVFAEYYEIMKHKLVDKVFNEEHHRLEANHIDNFVMNIVQYMIEKNTVFNVPLSHLQKYLTEQEKSIFNRFLDENILLSKDLTPERKGPFSHNEVVNFTYDSFRDYLISTYLLDVVESNDFSRFETLVKEYTRTGHQLREGLTPFLFVHARSSQNDKAIKLISNLNWYEEIFEMYIWDIDDILITQDDILLVKSILASDQPEYMAMKLIFGGHWNSELYPKLNIRVLLEYLAELNDKDLANFLDRIWPQTADRYKIYEKRNLKGFYF